MPKTVTSKMAWVGRTASMVFVVAVVLAGCSREPVGSGAQEKLAKLPVARDDRATTSEERKVMIEMVANDSGESLQIDGLKPEDTHGDIICDAGTESGKILSCAYTPTSGFTGTDRFEYTVKDANGKTDSAIVYVEVKPAN